MNAKPHDFTKPAPLPVAGRERLVNWTRAALAQQNKAWAKQLPVRLEAELVHWDGLYAQQALAGLPEPCLAYRVTVADGKVSTLLILPRSLMLNLVAALLGDDATAEAGERELTLVEEGLADYFLTEYWLSAFRETWPNGPTASWVLEGREPNPSRTRIFGADEVLQAFTWQISGPWGEANSVWLFPEKGLMLALGGAEKSAAPPTADPITPARRASIVQALPMVVQIILGTAEVKLSQLRRLQVGDVLVLDQNHDDQAVARVGNHELYRGRAGRTGSSKAFQIKSLLEK
jgi:flagellar motor switch protein FliM